ncbi:MAG: hypothetical protein KKB21_03745 [Nanoarchaeota archaeon]|nr:hypothetical protein [Nanoarchaeota archaeon]MBU4086661.1 hypothetical protein [Nanoarchaeota archaeon]
MTEEKDVRLIMIAAASSALDFLKKNPNADSEQVMKHVIKNLKVEEGKKIAGIAAANHVIKFKEKNPRKTDRNAIQNLSDSMSKILKSADIQNEDEEMLSL